MQQYHQAVKEKAQDKKLLGQQQALQNQGQQDLKALQAKIAAMERENEQLRQQGITAAKEPDEPKEDIDLQLATLVSQIEGHKAVFPPQGDAPDPHLQKLENMVADLKARKRMAKPIGTRQIQATRALDTAQAKQKKLNELREAKQAEYQKAMAQLDADLAAVNKQVQDAQAEVNGILEEVRKASDQPLPLDGDLATTFCDSITNHLQGTVAQDPGVVQLLDGVRQAIGLCTAGIQKIVHDQQQAAAAAASDEAARKAQAEEDAKAAAAKVAATLQPGGRSSDIMEVDEGGIDAAVDAVFPKFDDEFDGDMQAWENRKRAYRQKILEGKCKKVRLKQKAAAAGGGQPA